MGRAGGAIASYEGNGASPIFAGTAEARDGIGNHCSQKRISVARRRQMLAVTLVNRQVSKPHPSEPEYAHVQD